MYMLRKDSELLPQEFETVAQADQVAREVFADAVVKVDVVRAYPRLLTEEQRELLIKKIDLQEYANNCIAGDGLELDGAEDDFQRMTDVDFINHGFMTLGDEEAKAELRAACEEVGVDAQSILDAVIL